MSEFPIDRLGQFPILQFAFAAVALLGLVLAMLRGTRDRQSSEQAVPEQRYYFDGPLAEVLKLLRDDRNHLGRLVDILEGVPEEQRKQTGILDDIKDKIDNLPSPRRRR